MYYDKNKRIRTAIKFEDVLKVKSKSINQKNKNKILECLAIKCNKNLDNNFEIKIFNSLRYKTKNTHGTGCTLSSAITTFLSCGKPIKKSCELGIKYVNSAIKTNPKYGKGHGPINHINSISINRKFR